MKTTLEAPCGLSHAMQDHPPVDPMLERVPVPCFLLDEDGTIRSMNRAGAELLREQPESLAGRPFHPFVVEEARAILRSHLSGVFAGEQASCELPLFGDGGGTRWIQLLSRPLNEPGREPACVSSAIEITRVMRAEEQIQCMELGLRRAQLSVQEAGLNRERLEEQLRRAQKMEAIGVLAEGIAHDFNNLLQALYGQIQLLLGRKMDEGPDVKPLREMERITKRAADIVCHLLTFSRKMKPGQHLVEINEIVDRALEPLQRTIPGMITITRNLLPELPAFCADPAQIEQILVHLIQNSCDAILGAGEITVSTGIVQAEELPDRRRTDHRKERYLLIGVKDTGKGMDQETLKRIYEPFFTTKEGGKSTGLGLSRVYGIVKSHNGLIRCESAPGRGTTFLIYLPLDQSCAHPEPAQPKTPLERIAATLNRTILVVDDEEIIREITSEVLRQSGYRVLTAESGEQGLSIYRDNDHVDLVLLDLGMPGIGGEQCLEELLRMDERARVIITSGYSRHKLGQPGLDRIAGFLTKPYEYKTLLKAVREGLESASCRVP
jgi:PAS domain S-box-containing protein